MLAINLLFKSEAFQQRAYDGLMAACHDPRIGVLNADEVCPDYWNTYAQTVFYIFTEMILTTDRICDMFLGYCTKPVYETLEITTY